MKGKNKIWIILLLLPLACSKSLQISVPDVPEVLVANAQWQQWQPFVVSVTHSRQITDSIDTAFDFIRAYEINNAFVTVKQNNIVVDTLQYDPNNFRYFDLSKRTELNNNYEINVSAKGYTSVSATSPLLPLVKIEGTSLQKNAAYNASGNAMDKISFNFKDNDTSTDYYLIRIHQYNGIYATCVNTADTNFVNLISSNPFTTETCLDGDKLLLSDATFNGKTKQVVLYVSDEQMKTVKESGKIKKPYIDLLHITKDFFLYIKSANSYDIYKSDPFTEPINVFSNVKNGYGFFTAYSVAVDTLR